MINTIQSIRALSRNQKITIIVLFDFFIALFCWIIFGPPLSVLLNANFEIRILDIILINYVNFLIPFLFTCVYFYISGLYRSSIRYSDSRDLTIRSIKGSFIFGISWGFVYLLQFEIIRNQFIYIVFLRSIFLSFVFYASIQIIRDLARILIYPNKSNNKGKPILIYGAGAAGIELYQAIKNNSKIEIVGFFDNSDSLNGSEINNIPIFGSDSQIRQLKQKYKNLEIYLAIPSLSLSERRKIISGLEQFKIAVRSIPSLHEIVANQKKMIEMQDLSIDEILPRSIVKNSSIVLTGNVVMVTGAGGSIGSELVRQIFLGNPKKIVLFEISEINLYSIQSEIEKIRTSKGFNTEIIAVLGDVKNQKRVKSVIKNHSVDYIYHAAAYKHVPIVEYYENITEGIKNNVFGTKTICDVADECNVKKVVVISTDKAVRPTNIMGASKRLAEMVVQSKNEQAKNTKYCMVRFGNVINSSGSVVPLFRKQIAEGGPITITHKKVTRFFMTIAEASSLVIQAGEFSDGGEVFILDMGEQVKIIDLAEKLIYLSGMNISENGNGDGIEIREIGLRPGEKLYEELLISGDEIKTSNEKIFKSIEKHLSNDNLNKVLHNLRQSIDSNDINVIRNILIKNVEGYKELAETKDAV
jgi:FlaA1/EpsC-like NDP-sugar epimerase